MEEMKLSIYKKWAPEANPWSVWAKPVLFASMTKEDIQKSELPPLEDIQWTSDLKHKTAVIVDLPGEQAVLKALALAKKNFRPVPVLNGCKGPGMLVDVSGITKLLSPGGDFIETCSISYDAPPVFILDSWRMNSSTINHVGRFDNRWSVVPQDMPSGNYLKEVRINQIILWADTIKDDLAYILKKYEQAGIQIQQFKNNSIQKPSIPISSAFSRFAYRWSVLLGLKRNSTGGFGAIVPEPSSSGRLG